MKLRIVTTDPTTLKWKSLDAKLTAIANALNKTKNATWEVSIEYQDVTPEIVKGRITHSWFNQFSYPLFRKGYEEVFLHFSMKRWKELGLDQGIRGAKHVDTDYVGESYGRADENTKRGKSNHNQFVQVILHETGGHSLSGGCGVKDITHDVHTDNVDLATVPGFFERYDMAKWQPRYQEQRNTILSLLAKGWEMVKQKKSQLIKQKFIAPFPQWSKATQAYGVANPVWYPRTGIHIGTDFGTPVGTEIKAPLDGEITRTGNFPTSIGIWVEFKCGGKYIVFCHLKSAMLKGLYKQGQVIAVSGDTGFIKGIHTHVEGWHDQMNRSALTKTNARTLTFDVTKHNWQ